MIKFFLIIFSFVVAKVTIHGQPVRIDETGTAHMLSPIGGAFNRIFNDRDLDSFYTRLTAIRKNKKGVVRIVHIGDSHVQAGSFPGVVRTGLQQVFGNAGRGLVFPYNVIGTNGPADINSSSNIGWKVSKVAGSSANTGVAGLGIQSSAVGAIINLSIDSTEAGTGFTRLKFFMDSNPASAWLLRIGENNSSFLVKNTEGKKTVYNELLLDAPARQLLLTTMPSTAPKSLYGVSLENDRPGVVYHAIGVNGARYDQYLNAPLFWQQLPGLQADLYIISLGTNEVQRNSFESAVFRNYLNEFLKKLKIASPRAAVIITTPADSYKAGRPNPVLRQFNQFLFDYCTQHSLPVWDLYRITNGYGSAQNWMSRGLMTPDLVHFTAEGYKLQGQLLYNALMKGFNSYMGY